MRQIIAMGGGGFSAEPENPLLELYVLKQARRLNPSVCFIPTATGDDDPYTVKAEPFVADKPRMWTEKQLVGGGNNVKNVDLAPDGKRIVA
jgi:peptidase E